MEMKKCKLSEICELNNATLKSSDNFDEILYLDTSNITKNCIAELQPFFIKSAPSRAQRKVKDKTIIFSTVRPNQKHFGILNNPPKNLIVSTGFTTLDVKKTNDFDANYVYLKLTQPYIVNHLHTLAQNSVSSYPSINPDDIGNLRFDFPPLPTQQKIAAVLSSLDDKIALNKKINAKLEAMAKRLYDYWFVQFDFPNGEGKPYKTSGGKMVWNEVLKREIPEGWEVKRLGEVLCKIDSGKRPAGGIDKKLKTGIPSLGAECIDSLGVFDFSSTPFISETYRNIMTSGKIENNDILIYKDGAYVGKTTLFRDNFPYKEAFVNEHVFLVHAKEHTFEEYLYFTLSNPTYFQIMQNLGKAKAAQPGLNRDDLQNILIIIPSKGILTNFHCIIEPLFAEIFSNAKCIGKLLQMRDRSLPLLMNGQVEVEG